MALGFVLPRAIYAAAALGIPDELKTGPKDSVELAERTHAHAPSLYRLLRALASVGFFTEGDDRRFALTPQGAALQTDAPGFARSTILSLAGDLQWRAFGEFLHSVTTGETAIEKAYGMSFFDCLSRDPVEATLFGEAMIGLGGAEPPAVAAAYDFRDVHRLVDVGGGSGHLLATVLLASPWMHGVVYDQAHVTDAARERIATLGLADRCEIVDGDFFRCVPAGGDAYVLSHVLHDWDDRRCLTILSNCRDAMGGSGRLLVVEMVCPAGDAPHPGKISDLVMLAITGGMERTEEEYGALLANAGFELARIVPTASAVSVIEAVPA